MIMSNNYVREGVKAGIYESGSRTMDARPRNVCGKGINRLNPKSLTVAYSTSISTLIDVPAAAAAGSAGVMVTVAFGIPTPVSDWRTVASMLSALAPDRADSRAPIRAACSS